MGDSAQEPHTVVVPKFSTGLPKDASPQHVVSIVEDWANRFNSLVHDGDIDGLQLIFREDAWLRDMLCLTWDYRSIKGSANIAAYLKDNLSKSVLQNVRPRKQGAYAPRIKDQAPGVQWVESMIDFETKVGSGSGMVRLVPGDGDNKWQVYMLSFSLLGLKNIPEINGENRPHGGNNSLVGGQLGGNWYERRERQKEFLDQDPAVVVIGAGQSGLEIAACLGQLGVPTLIVDRNKRIGDNWRVRYRTLVTHDPVQYCHMPYLKFPPNWPTYTPKDKLADWFESYASLMELNVWMSTNLESSDYNEDTKSWTVRLVREDGSKRELRPRHVVFATGHSGEAYMPKFPGQEDFKGSVYHTSQHKDAAIIPDVASKKVVVVGSGNSGHDLCQNFCENGADVTMLQRGGTYVISVDHGLKVLHAGTYDETGPPTEDADIYSHSLPFPLQFAFQVYDTADICEIDKEMLAGLDKAGFKVDFGLDKSGLYRKYMSRGGGYYLDVGCSKLIADGRVKVRQSADGIKGFDGDGLILADGSKLPADIVVMATGYDSMRTTVRKAIGDKVADRLSEVWGLDDEGEIRGMWRYSGHPGFWYMGGNLALCRWFSHLLALQIKASEEGIYVAPR